MIAWLCLLCQASFPEKETPHKRAAGEGWIDCSAERGWEKGEFVVDTYCALCGGPAHWGHVEDCIRHLSQAQFAVVKDEQRRHDELRERVEKMEEDIANIYNNHLTKTPPYKGMPRTEAKREPFAIRMALSRASKVYGAPLPHNMAFHVRIEGNGHPSCHGWNCPEIGAGTFRVDAPSQNESNDERRGAERDGQATGRQGNGPVPEVRTAIPTPQPVVEGVPGATPASSLQPSAPREWTLHEHWLDDTRWWCAADPVCEDAERERIRVHASAECEKEKAEYRSAYEYWHRQFRDEEERHQQTADAKGKKP